MDFLGTIPSFFHPPGINMFAQEIREHHQESPINPDKLIFKSAGRLKIAILSCFHPYRGGIAQFNNSLYKELSKHHEVRAFNFKRQYPEFLFPGKTQYVEKMDSETTFESIRILDTINPLSYIKCAKRIREFSPDLLIMRYWMPFFAPSQGWVARHLNKDCKVISILDNVVPHEPHFFDAPLTRYFLGANDAFVLLCNAVKDDLLRFKPEARCIVSPHPIYSNFGESIPRQIACKELNISPDKKNLLFFGLIRDYKGLDILIDAFSKLDKSYQLIIAGEPYGSFEKYRKQIQASPLRENIRLFTNYIPDDKVAPFFCAADLCVLPYRTATQSGISSIAYHFNLPMVTTDVGGLKESIGETGTGIIAPKADSDSVKVAIESYFANSENKSVFSKNIEKEKQRLSWSTFAENLTNLYYKL